MLSGLKIRTRLLLVLAVPLVAVVGVAAFGISTLDSVKVGGDSYDEIVEAKDLVEDVAPPPEYIVESYLIIRQLTSETNENNVDRLVDQLADRRAAFEDRHDYWSSRLDDQPSLKFALLQDSYFPAQEFWTIVDERFLPAVEQGDLRMASRLADGPLDDAFERHRNAVDRVVRLATVRQQEVAAETATLVDARTRWLIGFVLIAAALAIGIGYLVVRSINRPLQRIEQELPRVASQLRELDLSEGTPDLELVGGGRDELGKAATAFNSVVETAVDLAAEQARIQRGVSETYLHLGRRNQNLLRRMLSFVSDLEQNERDEETLDHLFRLDHLATRMRRNAESLLVLAGAEPSRTWSQPIPVVDVVRSAISEIEDFARVDLAVIESAAVQGNAASDITHLLAELVENAAVFSPPTTRVTVHGRRREDGYLLSVVDHGLGMPPNRLAEANARVADTSDADAAPSKMLGLHVVARLAERHGLRVKLTENPSSGMVAMVWLPFGLVGPVPSTPSANGHPAVITEPVDAVPPSPPPSPPPPPMVPPVDTERSAVEQPDAPQVSPAGGALTQRRRGEHVPAAVATAPPGSTGEGHVTRSPAEVRSRLSSLQSGVAQGRRDRPGITTGDSAEPHDQRGALS